MDRSCPNRVSSGLRGVSPESARGTAHISRSHLQHALCRVVARYAAHATPTPCPGSTDQHPLVCRLDTPGADLGLALGPRPLQRPVEDVAAGQPQIGLEVERRTGLEAQATVAVAQDDVLDWFGQNRAERP